MAVSLPKTLPPPQLEKEQDEQFAQMYNVVLLDDDDHTYEYVIEMLQKLFLLTKTDAFRCAVEVDTTGRTVVMTCGLAEAEFGRDQIHAYGPDPRLERSKGSMRAVVEPAGPGARLNENN